MELGGLPAGPGTWREIMDLQSEAAQALSDVLLKLEQYEIAFARFRSIRRQFAEEHTRFWEAYQELFSKLSLLLPNIDPETNRPLPRLAAPTEARLSELEPLQGAYGDVCSDIQAYIIDLQIESQNEFLGSLFERQLPSRHPLDPSARVLTRDPDDTTERPAGSLV